MTSARRPLGPGIEIPEPPERDPRTRTAAQRAADRDWVEPVAPKPPRHGRRILGNGPVGDGR
ncbi:hypothetical protein ACFYT4_35020 [Streptomyces sp. NPDC004609]|uniref:hypothetical protein n=1 Tax=Streptomyces sp. NPDC004609 TaxID=3364704 RepID=UPI0036991179